MIVRKRWMARNRQMTSCRAVAGQFQYNPCPEVITWACSAADLHRTNMGDITYEPYMLLGSNEYHYLVQDILNMIISI